VNTDGKEEFVTLIWTAHEAHSAILSVFHRIRVQISEKV